MTGIQRRLQTTRMGDIARVIPTGFGAAIEIIHLTASASNAAATEDEGLHTKAAEVEVHVEMEGVVLRVDDAFVPL